MSLMVTTARLASSDIITNGLLVLSCTTKSSLFSKRVSFMRLIMMQRVSPGILLRGNIVSDTAMVLLKSSPSERERQKSCIVPVCSTDSLTFSCSI